MQNDWVWRIGLFLLRGIDIFNQFSVIVYLLHKELLIQGRTPYL